MKQNRYWSPYGAGLCLGLTLLATFFFMGRGLGASGAFSLMGGVGLHAVAPGYAGTLKYLSQYLDAPHPLLNWNLFLILGVFLGAATGSLATRSFHIAFDKAEGMSISNRVLTAFSGGVLIGFSARLARGCTSGVALTGGAELALSGWTFVIAMFTAGFLCAAVFRRFWS